MTPAAPQWAAMGGSLPGCSTDDRSTVRKANLNREHGWPQRVPLDRRPVRPAR
jgi:hypothetical protein